MQISPLEAKLYAFLCGGPRPIGYTLVENDPGDMRYLFAAESLSPEQDTPARGSQRSAFVQVRAAPLPERSGYPLTSGAPSRGRRLTPPPHYHALEVLAASGGVGDVRLSEYKKVRARRLMMAPGGWALKSNHPLSLSRCQCFNPSGIPWALTAPLVPFRLSLENAGERRSP